MELGPQRLKAYKKMLLSVTLLIGCLGGLTGFADEQHAEKTIFETLLPEVPFPLLALDQAILSKLNPIQSAFVEIPYGRSLQKNQADVDSPRKILAYRSSMANFEKEPPPIFIGHADRVGALEVISWNPKALRYEFLEVKDYASGKSPKVTAANRALCMSCHQGEGPIFPKFPWSETSFSLETAKDLARTRLRKIEKVANDNGLVIPFDLTELEKNAKEAPITAINRNQEAPFKYISQVYSTAKNKLGGRSAKDLLAKVLASVPDLEVDPRAFTEGQNKLRLVTRDGDSGSGFGLDGMVRDANLKLHENNLCRYVCGTDDRCKRFLLIAALLQNNSDVNQKEEINRLKGDFKVAVAPALAQNGSGYPSSLIPNRDPHKNAANGGETVVFELTDKQAFLKTEEDIDEKRLDTFLARSNVLSYFDDDAFSFVDPAVVQPGTKKRIIVSVEKEVDPAFPRPRVNDLGVSDPETLWNGAAACFHFSPREEEQASRIPVANVERAILQGALPIALSSNWPPQAAQILDSVRGRASPGADLGHCDEKPKQRIEMVRLPQLNEIAKKAVAQSQLSLFTKYCSRCHTNGAYPLPFGSSQLKELKAYRDSENKSVLERLVTREMPPPSSDLTPSENERRQMIELLKSGD